MSNTPGPVIRSPSTWNGQRASVPIGQTVSKWPSSTTRGGRRTASAGGPARRRRLAPAAARCVAGRARRRHRRISRPRRGPPTVTRTTTSSARSSSIAARAGLPSDRRSCPHRLGVASRVNSRAKKTHAGQQCERRKERDRFRDGSGEGNGGAARRRRGGGAAATTGAGADTVAAGHRGGIETSPAGPAGTGCVTGAAAAASRREGVDRRGAVVDGRRRDLRPGLLATLDGDVPGVGLAHLRLVRHQRDAELRRPAGPGLQERREVDA